MRSVSEVLEQLLSPVPVIPVLTLNEVDSALPLAETLVEAGLHVLEVTLRTPNALEVIRRMRELGDSVTVGAGTVLSERDLDSAAEAGAGFAVAPGATPALYRAASEADLPLLPGVATASEIMTGLEFGFNRFKFFPAEPAGGVAALGAFSGPFANVRFCPTGGIHADNALAYARLGNVMTVGGSWMAPAGAIEDHAWERIAALARDCVNLLGSP